MRAGPLFAGFFLLTAGQALAQPPVFVLPEPSFAEHGTAHMPLADNDAFQDVSLENEVQALARHAQLEAAAASRPVSLGPFSMDMGSTDVGWDGKRAHFAHVHVDDFQVLGGNVSGTFDGRAATVHLSWPTGQ